ncbi:carbohydrate ABC transporter permease [Rathayibacter sp. SD072]|uniref:carbohydrate ABC transporter permease n=1 Tax=Rathayibacter sp. SD072 TaxID=2781731 RepID=UPI001A95DC73|nr:sugar ABC transporter permease [Rathayibacter sp. SD072]
MTPSLRAPARPVDGQELPGSRPPTGEGARSAALHRRRSLLRTLPLGPATVILAIFLLGPILVSFWGSFTDSSLSGSTAAANSFVGFDNYVALFQDPDFPHAVILTVVFVLGSAVIGQNVLGLGLALLMRASGPVVRSIVGTIVVTAWVLPEIVAAFASYAFFRDEGTANSILALLGISGPSWLYVFPMVTVIVANIWRGTAFSMLVYSAALADVPPEITEAAEMDGASGVKRLLFVTIPMIRRTIATNAMITTLQTLSVFTLVYVMTGGGPGTSATTLPLLAYQEAFKFGQIGFGTAIATIMLLVGGIFSVFYVRALRSEVD